MLSNVNQKRVAVRKYSSDELFAILDECKRTGSLAIALPILEAVPELRPGPLRDPQYTAKCKYCVRGSVIYEECPAFEEAIDISPGMNVARFLGTDGANIISLRVEFQCLINVSVTIVADNGQRSIFTFGATSSEIHKNNGVVVISHLESHGSLDELRRRILDGLVEPDPSTAVREPFSDGTAAIESKLGPGTSTRLSFHFVDPANIADFAATTTGGLFSARPAVSFSTPQQQTTGLFGQPIAAVAPTTNLFGTPATPQTGTSSLFRGATSDGNDSTLTATGDAVRHAPRALNPSASVHPDGIVGQSQARPSKRLGGIGRGMFVRPTPGDSIIGITKSAVASSQVHSPTLGEAAGVSVEHAASLPDVRVQNDSYPSVERLRTGSDDASTSGVAGRANAKQVNVSDYTQAFRVLSASYANVNAKPAAQQRHDGRGVLPSDTAQTSANVFNLAANGLQQVAANSANAANLHSTIPLAMADAQDSLNVSFRPLSVATSGASLRTSESQRHHLERYAAETTEKIAKRTAVSAKGTPQQPSIFAANFEMPSRPRFNDNRVDSTMNAFKPSTDGQRRSVQVYSLPAKEPFRNGFQNVNNTLSAHLPMKPQSAQPAAASNTSDQPSGKFIQRILFFLKLPQNQRGLELLAFQQAYEQFYRLRGELETTEIRFLAAVANIHRLPLYCTDIQVANNTICIRSAQPAAASSSLVVGSDAPSNRECKAKPNGGLQISITNQDSARRSRVVAEAQDSSLTGHCAVAGNLVNVGGVYQSHAASNRSVVGGIGRGKASAQDSQRSAMTSSVTTIGIRPLVSPHLQQRRVHANVFSPPTINQGADVNAMTPTFRSSGRSLPRTSPQVDASSRPSTANQVSVGQSFERPADYNDEYDYESDEEKEGLPLPKLWPVVYNPGMQIDREVKPKLTEGIRRQLAYLLSQTPSGMDYKDLSEMYSKQFKCSINPRQNFNCDYLYLLKCYDGDIFNMLQEGASWFLRPTKRLLDALGIVLSQTSESDQSFVSHPNESQHQAMPRNYPQFSANKFYAASRSNGRESARFSSARAYGHKPNFDHFGSDMFSLADIADQPVGERAFTLAKLGNTYTLHLPSAAVGASQSTSTAFVSTAFNVASEKDEMQRLHAIVSEQASGMLLSDALEKFRLLYGRSFPNSDRKTELNLALIRFPALFSIKYDRQGMMIMASSPAVSHLSQPQVAAIHAARASTASLGAPPPQRSAAVAAAGRSSIDIVSLLAMHVRRKPNLSREDRAVSEQLVVDEAQRAAQMTQFRRSVAHLTIADIATPELKYEWSLPFDDAPSLLLDEDAILRRLFEASEQQSETIPVWVSCLYDTDDFYIIKHSDFNALITLLMDLQDTYSTPTLSERLSIPPNSIVQNLPVAVLCENVWYRGLVLVEDAPQIYVQLVDFGVVVSVELSQLRLIRQQFVTRHAAFAIRSRLTDVSIGDPNVATVAETAMRSAVAGFMLYGEITWIEGVAFPRGNCVFPDLVVSVCLCDTRATEDKLIQDVLADHCHGAVVIQKD